MKKLVFIFSLFFLSGNMFAQKVHYKLSMERPQAHYYQVEMNLSDFSEEEIIVKMPIWAPGSYLAREFAKNVNLVKAKDEKGKQLSVKKIAKNAWKISKGKSKSIRVNYEVYAFELTVRTSFLDLTHGFVSGSGVFMYVDKYKNLSGKVTVIPYEGFSKITTALKKEGIGVASEGTTFVFDDYDQLVDCPIEVGNQVEFSFDAAGVKHNVGIYGVGNFNKDDLKRDIKKIVESATNVFGQNPNKEYTFIIHNVQNGQGGLEHINSTVLSVNRFSYSGQKYLGFLSLVAHEYFHLWNVKRIRPFELGPFDYDNENYTSLLWVMEGFTSYYDELLLRRAGFYSKKQYLDKLFGTLNYVEGTPGTRVQPVSHASFDAWIKAYRPNENSRNTTISYYSKGTIIAAMLDAMIIKKYKGKKSLDDFMRYMYKVYYEDKKRGFKEEEFKQELETFLKQNLDEFYENYIDGTKIPDYNSIFSPVGVNVTYVGKPQPSVGVALRESGGKTIIYRVRSNSSAEDAGLSVNDEIIGCNGFRADKKSLETLFKSAELGQKINLLISRDQELFSIDVVVKPYEQPKFNYKVNPTSSNEKLLNFWLRVDEE